MARFKTPYFGEHAGRLTVDGAPAPDVAATPSIPVVLPVEPADRGEAKRRGRDGAAEAHMHALRQAGLDPTFSECQERVQRALTHCDNKRRK